MGAMETRVFKTGDSAAVRLPEAPGVEPGTLVRVEKRDPRLEVRPIAGTGAGDRVAAMVERLRALGPVGEVQDREPIVFPDRAGLD